MRTYVLLFLIVQLAGQTAAKASGADAADPVLGCYQTLTSMSDLVMPGPVPIIEFTATPATGQSWYPPDALVYVAHRDGKVERPLGFWRRHDGKIQITTSYNGFGGDYFELHEDPTGVLLGTWTVATDVRNDSPRKAPVAMKREVCE